MEYSKYWTTKIHKQMTDRNLMLECISAAIKSTFVILEGQLKFLFSCQSSKIDLRYGS